MKNIYLDYNSTSPLRPDVLEAMLPYLKNEFGNASSLHQAGQRARKAIEDARAQMAQFIGAERADEIIFTSGGTESNNLAIKGILQAHRNKGQRIVTSAIEHAAVRHVLKNLSDQQQIDHVVVPVEPNGVVGPQVIEDALTPDTILVSVMAANNEIGTLQPIEDIAELCKQKNVLFHTDAVQMAGRLPINVQEMNVDLLSLSAHKFGGPKGIGILYVRQGTQMGSLIEGGSQEKNRRGGTENTAAIVGMAKAAEQAQKELSEYTTQLKRRRDQFEDKIRQHISHSYINGERENRLSNTSNICFECTDSSAMVMALDLKGISCSNGSACASGSQDPSHVLLAMGLPQDKAHASLRFSMGLQTTNTDLDVTVKTLSDVVAAQRAAHPLWKEKVNAHV